MNVDCLTARRQRVASLTLNCVADGRLIESRKAAMLFSWFPYFKISKDLEK